MDKMLYVSPQNYLLNHTDWVSTTFKTGYISILETDLSKFEASLNNFKHGIDTASVREVPLSDNSQQESLKEDKNKEPTLMKGLSEEVDISFTPLKKYCSILISEHSYTISLRNLPYSDSVKMVDTFIHEVLRLVPVPENESTHLSNWSRIHSFEMEKQHLLLSFKKKGLSELSFIKTVEFLDEIGTKTGLFTLHLDQAAQSVMDRKTSGKEEKLEETIIQKFEALVKRYLTDNTSLKNDIVVNNSVEYQVDLTKLSDLPKESLQQLSKDITEFRGRVVNIEKLKLLKENHLESKRRRMKMKEVFESIKKAEAKNAQVSLKEDISEHYPDSDSDDDNDDLFDSKTQIEKIHKMEKKESNERYKLLLSKLNFSIEPRIQTMRKQLDQAINYEQSLRDNKDALLKNFLHTSKDIYHELDRTFKEEESRLDQINRVKFKEANLNNDLNADFDNVEDKVSDSFTQNEPQREYINIKLALKKQNNDMIEKEEAPLAEGEDRKTTVDKSADVLPFESDELETRLSKLRESRLIDELVKEFLGVYEEELVEYIIDNIKTNRSKKMLLDELFETFDTDAAYIVEKIWENI